MYTLYYVLSLVVVLLYFVIGFFTTKSLVYTTIPLQQQVHLYRPPAPDTVARWSVQHPDTDGSARWSRRAVQSPDAAQHRAEHEWSAPALSRAQTQHAVQWQHRRSAS